MHMHKDQNNSHLVQRSWAKTSLHVKLNAYDNSQKYTKNFKLFYSLYKILSVFDIKSS